MDQAFQTTRTVLTQQNDQDALNALEELLAHRPNTVHGAPFVFDTFWSAIHCLENSHSVKECIRMAIMMGNDTDTTACIAGGLAGLKFDEKDFPWDWKNHLPHQRDLKRIEKIMQENNIKPSSSPSLRP